MLLRRVSLFHRAPRTKSNLTNKSGARKARSFLFMATIIGLYNRVRSFDAFAAAEKAIDATLPDMLTENKRQLFDGKLRTGQDLVPTYLEDSWFKTPIAAANYSRWKDEITPSPNRTPGSPNLFVNGKFYQTFTVRRSGDSIVWGSFSAIAADVLRKWTPNIFGLGGPYKMDYINTFFRPVFNQLVFAGTGLRIGKKL